MKKLTLIFCVFAFAKAYAQQPVSQSGNVIAEFGKTYEVPNPDFKTDTDLVFKAVFDVSKAPEDKGKRNPYIETIARFFKHARESRCSCKKLTRAYGNARTSSLWIAYK